MTSGSRLILLATSLGLLLAACGGGSGGSAENAAPTLLSARAQLGKQIFFDTSLSGSGTQACASCHVPGQAHASINLSTNLGGSNGTTPGQRNTPSLRYLAQTPAFFFDREGTPTGGFNWDGRANSLLEQARRPFLAEHEMANTDAADVAVKLQHASYAAEFKALFGETIFRDPETAFNRALLALASYQLESPEFAPFSSRYDDFLAGKASLTAAEIRGLVVFNSPSKGNCAACHPSGRSSSGAAPLFTDFTYDNLGVPRNPDIVGNRDSSFFDLGLCGPTRSDLADRADLCGAFKVPSLRNVARTAPYFHNGKFATLSETLRFYARRDTHPEEFFPRNADGSLAKFDDLPAQYAKNVNRSEPPYNRAPGDIPAMSDADLADLEAFLNTLSDRE